MTSSNTLTESRFSLLVSASIKIIEVFSNTRVDYTEWKSCVCRFSIYDISKNTPLYILIEKVGPSVDQELEPFFLNLDKLVIVERKAEGKNAKVDCLRIEFSSPTRLVLLLRFPYPFQFEHISKSLSKIVELNGEERAVLRKNQNFSFAYTPKKLCTYKPPKKTNNTGIFGAFWGGGGNNNEERKSFYEITADTWRFEEYEEWLNHIFVQKGSEVKTLFEYMGQENFTRFRTYFTTTKNVRFRKNFLTLQKEINIYESCPQNTNQYLYLIFKDDLIFHCFKTEVDRILENNLMFNINFYMVLRKKYLSQLENMTYKITLQEIADELATTKRYLWSVPDLRVKILSLLIYRKEFERVVEVLETEFMKKEALLFEELKAEKLEQLKQKIESEKLRKQSLAKRIEEIPGNINDLNNELIQHIMGNTDSETLEKLEKEIDSKIKLLEEESVQSNLEMNSCDKNIKKMRDLSQKKDKNRLLVQTDDHSQMNISFMKYLKLDREEVRNVLMDPESWSSFLREFNEGIGFQLEDVSFKILVFKEQNELRRKRSTILMQYGRKKNRKNQVDDFLKKNLDEVEAKILGHVPVNLKKREFLYLSSQRRRKVIETHLFERLDALSSTQSLRPLFNVKYAISMRKRHKMTGKEKKLVKKVENSKIMGSTCWKWDPVFHVSLFLGSVDISWLDDEFFHLCDQSRRVVSVRSKFEELVLLDCHTPIIETTQKSQVFSFLNKVCEFLIGANVNWKYKDFYNNSDMYNNAYNSPDQLYESEEKRALNADEFSYELLRHLDATQFSNATEVYLQEMRKIVSDVLGNETANNGQNLRFIPQDFICSKPVFSRIFQLASGEQQNTMLYFNSYNVLKKFIQDCLDQGQKVEDVNIDVEFPGILQLLKGFESALLLFEDTGSMQANNFSYYLEPSANCPIDLLISLVDKHIESEHQDIIMKKLESITNRQQQEEEEGEEEEESKKNQRRRKRIGRDLQKKMKKITPLLFFDDKTKKNLENPVFRNIPKRSTVKRRFNTITSSEKSTILAGRFSNKKKKNKYDDEEIGSVVIKKLKQRISILELESEKNRISNLKKMKALDDQLELYKKEKLENENKMILLKNEKDEIFKKEETAKQKIQSMEKNHRDEMQKMKEELEKMKMESIGFQSELETIQKKKKRMMNFSKSDIDMFRISDQELKVFLDQKLGKGGFGTVFQGEMNIKREVAIKYIPFGYNTPRKRAFEEFESQVSFVHPNVIRTFGFHQPEGKNEIGIVMEKMDMNLHNFVVKYRLDLHQKFDLMYEMTKGLYFLHSRDPIILHRDIKGFNYLVSGIGGGEEKVKICDFGLVKPMDDTQTHVQTESVRGTKKWNAPEVQTSQTHSVHSDIYSLGVSFWEVLFERFPFEGEEIEFIPYLVCKEKKRPKLDIYQGDTIPELMKGLLEWCWHHDRKKRPTTDDLMVWFDENEMEFKDEYENMFFPSVKPKVNDEKDN